MLNKWKCDNTTVEMTYVESCWFNGLDANSQPIPKADLPPCERMEYRCLTDAQRAAFHACLQAMKTTIVDPSMNSNQFDIYTMNHRSSSAPEAHACPAFFPFHRYFIWQ